VVSLVVLMPLTSVLAFPSCSLYGGYGTLSPQLLQASRVAYADRTGFLCVFLCSFGLAWAVATRLADNVGARCLFATHFHELTDLESSLPGKVANVHFTAQVADGQLSLLYQVKPGEITTTRLVVGLDFRIVLPQPTLAPSASHVRLEKKMKSMNSPPRSPLRQYHG
jgi:hypothetical protein